VVVATQVIEAGVDISSRTLITELAPWAAMVQRAGRCNRYAEHSEARDAEVAWVTPPESPPYGDAELEEAAAHLAALDGQDVTPASLALIAQQPQRSAWQVLRRRDLISLFDTAPDLSGNDLDVARFIRDGDDLDVFVAWRPRPDAEADQGPRSASRRPPRTDPPPARDELCAVPVGQFRTWLGEGHEAWRHDPRARAGDTWKRLTSRDARIDLHPGITVVVPTDAGGYDRVRGWDPRSREVVAPMPAVEERVNVLSPEEAIDDDRASLTGQWVPLVQHLRHVAAAATALSRGLAGDLPPGAPAAIVRAGVLHDAGKAHPVFQDALVALEAQPGQEDRRKGGPWAKSGRRGTLRFARRGFRHELASALAVDAAGLLADLEEPELGRYLIAAHHGRVRLSALALPTEAAGSVLGMQEDDPLPGVALPAGWNVPSAIPDTAARLSVLELGGGWTAAALALRDRQDLGPFRLAWCEMLVRIADWKASAMESEGSANVNEVCRDG
jgi:CRISPR-associated endonuclease/helicase Cas3